MKIASRIVLTMALAGGMAFAQTMSNHKDNVDKQEHIGKTKTMTGCVQQQEGTYVLMDKHHPGAVQLLGSDDVQSQVGHKVKVTGTINWMDTEEAMAQNGDSDAAPAPVESNKGAKKEMSGNKIKADHVRTMNVTSMKSLSDHCEVK